MYRICLPMQETQETWVQSLGQEDPLEEEMEPTPVFLPGKFHGWRSLEDYSPWGHKESDMTEHTHTLSGGDGIPAELFKILKDDAVKVLSSIC